ncbi:MAG: hypothetical protein K2J24_04820 [Muribaculaceae bacterium]|nr:hypothetical protein [Muribaculaceae bacterium]
MTDFTCTFRALAMGIALAGSMTAMAYEGSIAIEVSNITSNDALVSWLPSSDELLYYRGVMDSKEFEFRGGAEKAIENRIAVWERNASYYDNTTWQDMMMYELKSGPVTEYIYDFYDTLMYDTSYVVYVFGMDPEGNVTAPVVTEEFTTLKPIASDNTFEVSLLSIEADSRYLTVTAHVQPSNDDRYMARCFLKSVINGLDLTPGSDDEKRFIVDNMLYYVNQNTEVAEGPHDFVFDRIRDGEEYCVVVMGLDENMSPSTALEVFEFVAVETNKPMAGTITLEVSDITPMNAHIQITPSSDEIYYYFDVTTPDIIEMKGGIENIPEKLIIDWWKFMAEIYGGSYVWQDFIEPQTTRGPLDFMAADMIEEGMLSEIYWNSEWVLYAVGFNLEGEIVTEPAVLYFSTPDCEKSDLTFECSLVDMQLDEDYPNTTRKYYKATIDIYPSNDDETFRVNYSEAKFFDKYFDVPLGEEPDMFDFITRVFMPYSAEFTGPIRLVLPGLAATNAIGDEERQYYVYAMGWNEGPTTEIELYPFDCNMTGVTATPADDIKVKTTSGRVILEGDFETGAVYSTDGRVMGALRPGYGVDVPTDVYVVRYTTRNGASGVAKVIVK